MSELQNQLKNQSLDELLPSSLKEVAGVVFPDERADMDLNTFASIVDHWRSVHVPSYGQPIAGTVETKQITGAEGFFPASNEVYKLQGFTFENTSPQSVVFNFKVGSFPILANTTVAGNASSTPTLLPSLFFDKASPLSFEILSGLGSSLEATFLLVKVAQ